MMMMMMAGNADSPRGRGSAAVERGAHDGSDGRGRCQAGGGGVAPTTVGSDQLRLTEKLFRRRHTATAAITSVAAAVVHVVRRDRPTACVQYNDTVPLQAATTNTAKTRLHAINLQLKTGCVFFVVLSCRC